MEKKSQSVPSKGSFEARLPPCSRRLKEVVEDIQEQLRAQGVPEKEIPTLQQILEEAEQEPLEEETEPQ